MEVQTMPVYLLKITTRANKLSNYLLKHPFILYHYQIYQVPYKLSKLVIFTSKSYRMTDYIESMAAAAILDYRTQYYKSWLKRKYKPYDSNSSSTY